MEVTKEQAMAYTEVLEVLKYMPVDERSKVPPKLIKYYEDNRDTEYSFELDKTKSFEEQVLLEKTKIVLAILFRDYWATDEQRQKIMQKEKYDLNNLEQEKIEKYNPDDIFKNNDKKEQEAKAEETKALVEYQKESWYSKFINFIKKIFKK